MSRNIIETVLGAVVVVIAVVFVFFAYHSSNVSAVHGYQVTAKFEHIDSTQPGGDVRISGIKVGTIVSQQLDPKTYQAIVVMSINNEVKIPVDSVATITSSGLLGEKYMALVPGADDKMIPAGGEIKITQPPVSLEAMLGQYVFSNQSTGAAKPPSGGTANGAAPTSNPAPSSPIPSK